MAKMIVTQGASKDDCHMAFRNLHKDASDVLVTCCNDVNHSDLTSKLALIIACDDNQTMSRDIKRISDWELRFTCGNGTIWVRW